jgi:hypothetical protein
LVVTAPCGQTLTSPFTVQQLTTASPDITAPANGSVTNNPTPTYEGMATTNTTVTVYVGLNAGTATAIGTTTPNGARIFFLTQPTALPDGVYKVYATAQLPGQNVSMNSLINVFTVDTTPPTVVAISSTAGASGGSTSTSPIPFTVTFSENVTGFAAGDITVGNGTITGGTITGSGSTYTFTVTPSGNGLVTVNVPANVVQDQALNFNTAAAPFSITYTAPSATVVSVTGLTPSPTATAQVSYRVVFSNSVLGLSPGNFNVTTTGSVSGASVASVSGSGTTYTVVVNTGSGDGTLRLDVNNSTGVTPGPSNVPYTSGTTYTITKSFPAAPTLAIVGTGGTGTDATAFVDVVQVLSGGTAFANGLQNSSFETHGPYNNGVNTFSYGTSGAVWAFNARAGISDQGSAFAPVTPIPNGIAVAFVQSNGGGNGQLQQNLAVPTGSNYQVSFQAAQRLCCTTLDQALNVFLNGVFLGNIQPRDNEVYQTFTSATFSVTAPALTATVSTTSASPTSAATIPFTVTFSQSVGTTFTAADVTVTGGTVTSGSFSGSGSGPYTFTVTPTGTGTVSVSLAANVAQDANNTNNSASNLVSVQFVAPTLTVSPASLPNGTQGVAYSQTITASGGSGGYSYVLTGTLPTGLTLTGGTLSGTPTASGTFNFRITATDNSAAPGPYSGFRDYALTIAAPTDVVWNGSQSTDWYTAANWTPNVVPTISLNATVPGSAPNQPFIGASTAFARNLTLNSGATLTQTGGTLDVRADLTNNGTFRPTGGTVVLGTTLQTNGPNLLGSGTIRFWDLTVNSNGVLLSTSAGASVQHLLTMNGAFVTQGNTFTLESNATSTALVVNNAGGFVFGTATVQRYIAPDLNPGLGYRHYSAPVGLATVASLTTASFTPVVNPAYNTSATPTLLTTSFPTVYGYDQSRLASTNNNLNAFDKGWFSPATLSDPLAVGQGYTVNLAANQSLSVSGPLNNNALTVNLARNSGATAADAGWALVGNPYPSPLDYTQVVPTDRPGLDAAIYVFESTSQYGGTYRASVNGVGGNANSPNSLLAQGQGFFVRVSNGQTSGSLTFRNSQRLTSYANPVYHRTTETRPLVQLDLQGAGQADPVYVYFENGATPGVDRELDAVKLPNSTGLNVSAETGAQRLAIDALPTLGTATVVVPLTVGVPAAGSFSFNAAQLLNLGTTPVYLRDLLTGAVVDLRAQPRYAFTVSNAAALITGRFELMFSPQAPLATASAALTAQVVVYPNPASKAVFVELPAALSRKAVTAGLVDALGRVVVQRVLPAGLATHTLPLTGLATGVYSLRLQTDAGIVVKKLVVE